FHVKPHAAPRSARKTKRRDRTRPPRRSFTGEPDGTRDGRAPPPSRAPARLPVSLDSILPRVTAAPFFTQLRKEARALGPGGRLRLKGTVGSLPAFALAHLAGRTTPLCCLLPEPDAAAYLQ